MFVLACGCGSGPANAPPPSPLDVFHDVYLRGGPGDGRVALTFEAVTPCTADLLARLRAPAEGAAPVVATFFVDRASLEAAVEADPVALEATLRRIVAEGHGLALTVARLPQRWRLDPASFRDGLVRESREVTRLLEANGVEQAQLSRLWRPPAGALDLVHLGRVADVDRPAVLWSLRAEVGPAERMVADIAARVADGDIVSLPGAGKGCPAVDAVASLADVLQSAGLRAVTLHALLGRALARHEPLRVVRYHGKGLPAPCHAPLNLAATGAPDQDAQRWGLVHYEQPDGTAWVLPLPGAAGPTSGFIGAGLPVARRLWSDRESWRARPGCLRAVPAHRMGPPVTAEADGRRARWWVVGRGGVEERDPRALTAATLPVVLPTRADLVRLEAVQRLPWRLRGLVAGALGRLGLEVPLLVEARATTGLVVGRPLDVSAVSGPRSVLRDAIAGYVQILEVSLAEYLYLAGWSPSDRKALRRAARGADGFVRAGPFWTLSAVAGGTPDPMRTGPNGRVPFDAPPEALLVRALQAGARLRPGDVVAAAPEPVEGPPRSKKIPEAGSFRAAVRAGLTSSIVRGLTLPAYLRAGGVLHFDGDLLGRQTLRVAVPPGVDVPTLGTGPGEAR